MIFLILASAVGEGHACSVLFVQDVAFVAFATGFRLGTQRLPCGVVANVGTGCGRGAERAVFATFNHCK